MSVSSAHVDKMPDASGHGEIAGSVHTDEGRERLRTQLAREIDSARNEALTAEQTAVDPVLKAILATHANYKDSDPATAEHLHRMAAMRIGLPYTREQSDALEAFMGGWDSLETLLYARLELDGLPEDPSDPDFSYDWFEAYVDLSSVTGADCWPQVR
jgi:hypothetical protein